MSEEQQQAVEELWHASVRRDARERYRKNAQARLEYHQRQLQAHERTLGELMAFHLGEAERFRRMIEDDDIPEPDLKLGPGMAEVVL